MVSGQRITHQLRELTREEQLDGYESGGSSSVQ
jgi:hypothetical protein